MAMHIPPTLYNVKGDELLKQEERLSILIKKAEMNISEIKELGCKHLITPDLLKDLDSTKQALHVVEKELLRRSANN